MRESSRLPRAGSVSLAGMAPVLTHTFHRSRTARGALACLLGLVIMTGGARLHAAPRPEPARQFT